MGLAAQTAGADAIRGESPAGAEQHGRGYPKKGRLRAVLYPDNRLYWAVVRTRTLGSSGDRGRPGVLGLSRPYMGK